MIPDRWPMSVGILGRWWWCTHTTMNRLWHWLISRWNLWTTIIIWITIWCKTIQKYRSIRFRQWSNPIFSAIHIKKYSFPLNHLFPIQYAKNYPKFYKTEFPQMYNKSLCMVYTCKMKQKSFKKVKETDGAILHASPIAIHTSDSLLVKQFCNSSRVSRESNGETTWKNSDYFRDFCLKFP